LELGGGGIDPAVLATVLPCQSAALNVAIETHSSPNFWRDAFRSMWKALTLQSDACTPILEAEKPSRQGFKILIVALLIAAPGGPIPAAV
jgi:hypothetical protein